MKIGKYKTNNLMLYIQTILGAIIIMTAVLYIGKYVPFGDNSLATEDINYTQLDLYAYLKDIISGKNTFGYTLSMGLGGDTMNVIGYSMTSPLNLLVALFSKENFHLFFTCLVSIKIPLIALSMAYFLTNRFNGKIDRVVTIILSLSFAFSQYCIAQICNIFWLDGVMLLPLICLGIYKLINDKNQSFFILTVLTSILFNWYTGGINCLFSIFWFFLEIYLFIDKCGHKMNKEIVIYFIRFALSGIIGVMMSMILLLPIIAAIQNGNRGSFNFDLFGIWLNGDLRTVISNNLIGALSTSNEVSLFCGTIPIIGCVGYFFSKRRLSSKVVIGLFLFIIILSFYWQPLYLLFSMFKGVFSFWSRYGYIGHFTVIFIAALFYEGNEAVTEQRVLLIKSAGIYVFLICFFSFNNSQAHTDKIPITLVFLILCSYMLSVYVKEYKRKVMITIGLTMVCSLELAYSTKTLLEVYHIEGVDNYKEYVKSEQSLIDTITTKDSSYFRISKSLTRNMALSNTTANYNEPFGYNYWGITAYTNSPDDRQRNMLDKMGYRINGENFYIVNTSIIPVDSLLGVKYFLSPFEINGYKKVDSIPIYNQKTTYENPYCLPFAFKFDGEIRANSSLGNNSNPFEYINDMYSDLMGDEVDLFIPLQYERIINNKNAEYIINIPEGQYQVYGNIPWENETGGRIYIEDDLLTVYAKWCSPSVFSIPSDKEQRTINLRYETDNGLSIADEQFYALDLDLMKVVADEINSDPVSDIYIGNKYIKIETNVEPGQRIFTSIPYDKGWTYYDNGKEIEPELFENCLVTFSLDGGEHVIEMKYDIPGLGEGCIISGVGIVLFVGWMYLDKKRKKV